MSLLSVILLICGVVFGFMVGFVLAKRNNLYKNLHDATLGELKDKNNLLNELSQKLASKQAIQEYLEIDIDVLKKQKTDTDNCITVLREKVTHLESQSEFYTKQRHADLAEIDSLKQKIDHITLEKKHVESLKSDADLQLNTIFNKCEFYEKQRTIDINDIENLKQKIDSLNFISKQLESKKTDIELQLNSALNKGGLYAEQNNLYVSDIANLKNNIDILLSEKKSIETHKSEIDIKYNSVAKENEHLKKRLEEQQQEFLRLQKNSEQTFENLANKIFNEKSTAFTQKSEKTLNDVLMPVRESLGLFQNLVHEKFNTQDKQQYALREELKRIIDINEKMTFQADSLTKALKGDNKIMGNWGEMLLERILEDSGLTKNTDYVLQATGYDLKDVCGKRQIPDVIVKLPESKEIIIDAKVSLVDYERLVSNPDERTIHEKAFLKSVRSHIDGLSSKKYHHNEKLLSPDFVLMFMPIEGAYNLAMQLDNQLHHYAWNRRIAIVSNTTLFATLRTVASLWRIEKQNKNAEEIANRAGLLYEKFSGFIEDMNNIDDKFNQTHKLFDKALGKLHTGRGNLISQVESLKELGAKTSKSITANTAKEHLKEVDVVA